MKNLSKILILCGVIVLMGLSCDEDEKQLPIIDDNYYIVGFENCTVYGQIRIGYYIISDELNEPLLTYNISDSIYKMPASIIMYDTYDTLYQIPAPYFQNYMSTRYFPDSVLHKFKLKIEYREAVGDEIIYLACPDHIIKSDFLNAKQVIVTSAIKE